jgi:predicted dehydrogenase
MHGLTRSLQVGRGADDAGPVQLAVVGLGYWGPNLVRNVADLTEAELAYICDLRPDRLERMSRRYPGARCTTSYDDVLNDPDVDGVAIATPVSTHYRLARAALLAGKHVLVEKPLAASSQDAEELVALAAELDLLVMAGHTFVYSPPVNAVRELISSGELGQVYFISTSRVNLGLHQSDASVAWDLGPHDFSILQYWLGELPARISALSRGFVMPSTPDVAFINLEYDSGIIAHVELSWLAPSKLRRTAIVGSEKMVVYDDTSAEPIRIYDSGVALRDPASFGEYKLTYRTGDIVSPRVEPVEPLALELSDYCRCIQHGEQPRSTAGLGLDVVRVIEAVEASLEQNGAFVHVRQPRTASSSRPSTAWPV